MHFFSVDQSEKRCEGEVGKFGGLDWWQSLWKYYIILYVQQVVLMISFSQVAWHVCLLYLCSEDLGRKEMLVKRPSPPTTHGRYETSLVRHGFMLVGPTLCHHLRHRCDLGWSDLRPWVFGRHVERSLAKSLMWGGKTEIREILTTCLHNAAWPIHLYVPLVHGEICMEGHKIHVARSRIFSKMDLKVLLILDMFVGPIFRKSVLSTMVG